MLGDEIKTVRKRWQISVSATAEAAGVSRVTLYRIERGEPSVTVGAYANVLAALGLELDIRRTAPSRRRRCLQHLQPPLPVTVCVSATTRSFDGSNTN